MIGLNDVLDDLRVPARPIDGDCLEWAPAVTELLVAAGHPAMQIQVIGRSVVSGLDAIVFVHRATKVGHRVIDCTARQFHPDIPLKWVTDAPDYIHTMIKYTGVSSVTLTVVP